LVVKVDGYIFHPTPVVLGWFPSLKHDFPHPQLRSCLKVFFFINSFYNRICNPKGLGQPDFLSQKEKTPNRKPTIGAPNGQMLMPPHGLGTQDE